MTTHSMFDFKSRRLPLYAIGHETSTGPDSMQAITYRLSYLNTVQFFDWDCTESSKKVIPPLKFHIFFFPATTHVRCSLLLVCLLNSLALSVACFQLLKPEIVNTKSLPSNFLPVKQNAFSMEYSSQSHSTPRG